jgi:diguanylate cyclase (GGDEF)-like protein/PAS domain S-box-containing protein
MSVESYTAFLVLAFCAAVMTAALGIYAWLHRSARGAGTFAMLMGAVTVWTAAIGGGMMAPTEGGAFSWAVVRMIGVVCTPVLWLAFSLQFSGVGDWIANRRIIYFFIIPTITIILMISSDNLNWFLREILYRQVGPYTIDTLWELGPWFSVHLVYSYALILIGDYYLIREAIRLQNKYRWQAIALLVGAALPLIVNLLFTFHLIPNIDVNYDPVGFVLAGLAFAWGIFSVQLFDIKPIARRLLVDSMSDSMFVLNDDNRIIDMNPAAEDIITLPVGKAIGQPAKAVLNPKCNWDEILVDTAMQKEVPLECEGMQRVYDLRMSPVIEHGVLIGRLLVARDITESKVLEEKLRELAISDPGTGLYNRRYFFELAEKEYERIKRYNRDLSVILLDFDHFKLINDRYGHQAGDKVLRRVAYTVRNNLRRIDIIARYGGEEFVMLLPETDEQGAELIAERIREMVEETTVVFNEQYIRSTVSMGIATFTKESDLEFEELISRADKALYQSKSLGRNQVTVWRGQLKI